MRVAELQAFGSDFTVLNLFHAKNCFNSISYVQLNCCTDPKGKLCFKVDLNFARKKKNNLIRLFNIIYTVAPSVCDVQGMQKGSAHLNEQTHQQGRPKITILAAFHMPHKDWKI